ncbi:hypothetical protein LMIY3S_01800 [Labrys miyagiensis]
MGHPPKLLTNRQLANWHAWLDDNVRQNASGAMDGAPRLKPGVRHSPTLAELRPGGRHDVLGRRRAVAQDSAPSEEALSQAFGEMLERLARKLGPAEWKALHQQLRGDVDEPEQAEDDETAETRPARQDWEPQHAPDVSHMSAFGGPVPSAEQRQDGTRRMASDSIGFQPRPRPSTVTAASVESFYAQFPEARK